MNLENNELYKKGIKLLYYIKNLKKPRMALSSENTSSFRHLKSLFSDFDLFHHIDICSTSGLNFTPYKFIIWLAEDIQCDVFLQRSYISPHSFFTLFPPMYLQYIKELYIHWNNHLIEKLLDEEYIQQVHITKRKANSLIKALHDNLSTKLKYFDEKIIPTVIARQNKIEYIHYQKSPNYSFFQISESSKLNPILMNMLSSNRIKTYIRQKNIKRQFMKNCHVIQ